MDRKDKDYKLFIDTARDVIDDLKLLVSGTSDERVPDVIRLIRGISAACECILLC